LGIAFRGTPDDARTLLIAIASTLATVIALVLGLTVVALQLASTQFSPRLLRNFLRDRVNQLVLSVFAATFTYSTGRPLHGRRLSGATRPGLPAAGGDVRPDAVVREPADVGVLRAPRDYHKQMRSAQGPFAIEPLTTVTTLPTLPTAPLAEPTGRTPKF